MDINKICAQLSRDQHGIYVAPSQNEAGVSYPEDAHASCFQVEDDSFWFNHRNTCIDHIIRNHPYEGMLLDIGGGNGFVSAMLQKRGGGVVLLEPGYNGAFNARTKRGVEHVLCATVEDCNFAPSTFGAIGLFDVVEHIREDRVFMQSLKPLLMPSGRVYLTVPCHSWLWSQNDIDGGHFRRHTMRSLRGLLEPDFEIEYLSYFFSPLIVPQFVFRALPFRLGLDRQKKLNSRQREHGTHKNLAARTIAALLRREASKIARGHTLRVGASCLVAASMV